MDHSFTSDDVLVVVMAQPGFGDKQSVYKSMKPRIAKQFIGIGTAQIIIGILCIGFQSADIGFSGNLSFIAHGIWTGIMFIITGSFGISAGHKKNRCQNITFSVLSIICASSLAPALFGLAITSMIVSFPSPRDPRTAGVSVGFESALIGLGCIEWIISIWSAIISCKVGSCCCYCGECCCCPPPTFDQTMLIDQMKLAKQSFIINSKQPMFILNQDQPTIHNLTELENGEGYEEELDGYTTAVAADEEDDRHYTHLQSETDDASYNVSISQPHTQQNYGATNTALSDSIGQPYTHLNSGTTNAAHSGQPYTQLNSGTINAAYNDSVGQPYTHMYTEIDIASDGQPYTSLNSDGRTNTLYAD